MVDMSAGVNLRSKMEKDMPIVPVSKRSGSFSGSVYKAVEGYQYQPFDPSIELQPFPYLMGWSCFLKHDLWPKMPVLNETLWGELVKSYGDLGTYNTPSPSFDSYSSQAYARAYAKLKDKAYTQASNLTAFAELSKTRQMVLSRLGQLLKGAKQLKNGRFQDFLRTFGIRPLKKDVGRKWSRPRQFSALWLEYWMGWAPTIGDVALSIETLTRDVPNKRIRAGSRVKFEETYTALGSYSRAVTVHKGFTVVNMACTVNVTNPDTHLQQKLGLINVAKTVWETIPFSWFVDWFTNVGQVLGQFTDWIGLQLENLVLSTKCCWTRSWTLDGARYIYGSRYPLTMHKLVEEHRFLRRVITSGLPLVKPVLRFPDSLSMSRGATLSSLLTTMFAPRGAH